MDTVENLVKWQEERERREARMDEAFGAYRSAPKDHLISAMPVVIAYTAIIGRVEYYKSSEEPVFKFTRDLEDGRQGEQWEEVPENAYAIRDEFLRIKTPEKAPEFLRKTGRFCPLSDRITWEEFKRWQRFAYLVQEQGQLRAAMNESPWSGECGEVLNALTGLYPSSFFDGYEIPCEENEWYSKYLRDHPKLPAMMHEGRQTRESYHRTVCEWFRQPPFSIEWLPKSQEIEQEIRQKRQRGGAMIEFLLPKERLQPVLFIRPTTTLTAIAAAIYAERIQGVEYRTCLWCGDLFKVGKRSTKTFCGAPRPCKGNAKKKRTRDSAKVRKAAEPAALKPHNAKPKSQRKA